ncbi:hypothetical protein [Clostridium cellulovorans]|uniref:Uncharacterized protein n=1 Tax=Clostridium cellulovorans (strain ATCC 35296 / DSM 3052 / OCM 3 / 743B) TaxID=573061 RepID=D9SNC9_CLOC7|nr:hypothetical protein [Clostridium cellulovorans]ADL53921.1 hypothetical protein Clocel_4260 [Clostridium cellulovorans 743B]
MINIVIYGINTHLIKILKLIDVHKCNVIAIITNNEKNIGKELDSIPIIGVEGIEDLSYELMISTIDDNVGNDSRIINFKKYYNDYYDFEIGNFLYKLNKNSKMIDGFITGLSYAEVGIDEEVISGNVINAAISSQDIFYDYEVAKYILNKDRYASHIKFALIGLTYYSFEFDLSKASIKDRVYYYYPFIGDIHNKDDSFDKKCQEFRQLEMFLKKILIEDYKNEIYKDIKEECEVGWKKYISGNLTSQKIEMGKENAKKDSLKNYPKTVAENIKILNEYIEFLKEKNVTPYIIILPTSKYYYYHLSERITNEFRLIIEEISKKKDVKVYDYFNSNIFNDDDFYDAAHLNRIGARKFTELINSEILIS